jgi:hypothetical protein
MKEVDEMDEQIFAVGRECFSMYLANSFHVKLLR